MTFLLQWLYIGRACVRLCVRRGGGIAGVTVRRTARKYSKHAVVKTDSDCTTDRSLEGTGNTWHEKYFQCLNKKYPVNASPDRTVNRTPNASPDERRAKKGRQRSHG